MTCTTTANTVIVIGMLDTMLIPDRAARRDRESGRRPMVEITHREARNRGRGGTRQELRIQVRSPYGGMFTMPIELEPDVPGGALLETAAADTLLAFAGTLQLKQTFDPRFARDATDARGRLDRGKPARTLRLLVSQVRQPSEEERRATSAVWLEGVVTEPPQVSRHPDVPSVQLASTILRVTFTRPADFPGLNAAIDETAEVNVSVATSNAQAAGMYLVGNRVRVQGQLDCRMQRQGGESVTAKLAEIDAAWAQQRAALADAPGQRRAAEQTYRRRRAQFEEEARLYVLGLQVELVEGTPIALEATYDQRRAFIATSRQQRADRRARREADQARRQQRAAAHAAQTADSNVAERIGDMPVIATVADVGIDPAAGTTRAGKPRRRADEVSSEVIGAALVLAEAPGGGEATNGSGHSDPAVP